MAKFKICERCRQEKEIELFRLKNRKLGRICLDCRKKCVVCNNPIANQTSLGTKYCSDNCRRTFDYQQRARKRAEAIFEDPDYYKKQYEKAKARGWKTYNPDNKREYYYSVAKQRRQSSPELMEKQREAAKAYYHRNRDEILEKKQNMMPKQREIYNRGMRNWRRTRLENMTAEQIAADKRHANAINRQSRARSRLEKMRLDFAKIENLTTQNKEQNNE